MKYRQDIDGLRAIAVLSVVLYHAGVSWFPGGFVGVDIFFVISGYLITRILLEEASAGRYSIAKFYARRARRILPVLYFILVVALLLGLLLLLPLEILGLSESVLATTLFSSNILFWKQSGYFDISAELKPLLHIWSLAVEEQFYVLWPLVLILCYRRGWGIRWVIAVLFGLSLTSSCVFLTEKPNAVFYLLPGRAWELLVGAWLATANGDWLKKQWLKSGLSVMGLGLLAASVLVLNKTLPFPAWNALYPCLGAALLIVAGEGALVNRYLLAWRPLVFVGLISYSLYLWHWPLLSYVRIMNLGQLPPVQAGIVVVLSFLLATDRKSVV
jgi:peptidoglycan/LPS O-acetylase OafA/YrhL